MRKKRTTKKRLLKKAKSYAARRDFSITNEPKWKVSKSASSIKSQSGFVLQKHNASHLHYDLRLEIKGVLKSWAIPKNPFIKIGERRLAILTEDHPLSYAKFEGTIPEGEYGAGTVKIVDKGHFINLKDFSMESCFRKGKIEIVFVGKKLKGPFALIHFKEKNWLFIRMKKRVKG
jgi:bifunctional non-homologous end joining protein LigD